MKRLTTILMTGALLGSGTAWAKDYGDSGTIDLSGNFGFTQRTVKMTETETDADSLDDTNTDIEIQPEVAFFLLPGLAILGSASVSQSTLKDNLEDDTSSDQRISIQAGGGYLLGVGTARLGPFLKVGFIQGSSKSDFGGTDAEDTYSGPSVQLGGAMKLPVGSGGVITAALMLEQNMLKYEYEGGVEADVTETGVIMSLGVGVWF